MATTDDLIISIRADVGRLESQLRNIDQQLAIQRQGNETAKVLLKVWHCSFELAAAVEGTKEANRSQSEFGILKAGFETARLN